jgi:hypothetical protein
MKVIATKRRKGKTIKTIEYAAKDGGYIVCKDQQEASRVFHFAKELGLDINFPLTFDEFLDKQFYARGIKSLYIDNLDLLIQYMSPHVPIKLVTLTDTKEKS